MLHTKTFDPVDHKQIVLELEGVRTTFGYGATDQLLSGSRQSQPPRVNPTQSLSVINSITPVPVLPLLFLLRTTAG